jgi:hypothetical protein
MTRPLVEFGSPGGFPYQLFPSSSKTTERFCSSAFRGSFFGMKAALAFRRHSLVPGKDIVYSFQYGQFHAPRINLDHVAPGKFEIPIRRVARTTHSATGSS